MKKGTTYRAKWVLPVTQEPIEDGAVVIAGGQIMDVGKFTYIKRRHLFPIQDCGEVALMPGLVNAHCHIELSALRKLGITKHEGNFLDWVRKLLAAREAMDPDEIGIARSMALEEMKRSGTVAFGDVGNEFTSFLTATTSGALFQFFWEIIGFKPKPLQGEMEKIPRSGAASQLSDGFNLAAHALYSTSPEMITEIKAWNRKMGRRMSIHISEHEEEIHFLLTGKGPCKDLLEERNQWNPAWIPPGCSPVEYLDRLGVLDEKTIGVHLVHVDKKDLEIVRKRNMPVVVCPRSNWHLHRKLPPLESFLEMGICCGLGTDSLASNKTLNLFDELAFLESKCGISPEKLIKIATLEGAKVLGFERELGSLDRGKRAFMLEIPVKKAGGRNIFSEVILEGQRGNIRWIDKIFL